MTVDARDIIAGDVSDSKTIAPAELHEVAERIRTRVRRLTTDIIAIGEDLINVKTLLPHGEFIEWIDREFGMAARTAQRYIKAAEWAKDKNDIVSHLPPSTVYLLSASSTPIEITERVVADLNAGHVIDHAALQKEVQQHRATGDASNDRTDYRTFQKKIGSPAKQSQQVRIDDFMSIVSAVENRCGNLEDVYIERLYDRDSEVRLIAKVKRAQRDLKRFLNRVNGTYASNSGRNPYDMDGTS